VHVVSSLEASSPAALVVPAKQAAHTLLETYWLMAHKVAVQVAAASVPAVHEDVPETVYPEAHVGAQVDPDASVLVQVPTAPLVGAPDASHGLAAQVAAASVPVVHEDVPETVYPEAHVGWQVDPDASVLVQVPTAPLVGALGATHGHAVTVLV
jgi:hypothetical protein